MSKEIKPEVTLAGAGQKNTPDLQIPEEYRGLPSEMVEILLVGGELTDPTAKQEWEQRKSEILAAVQQEETAREAEKRAEYTRQYQNMTDEQRREFPEHQQKAQQHLIAMMQGKDEIAGLLREEEYVLRKLQGSYQEFKAEHPHDPWKIEFDSDIDKAVFDNLGYRLAFGEKVEVDQAEDVAQITRLREVIKDAEVKAVPVNQPEKTPETNSLNGWPASYELAKVARSLGVDLTRMSREDYVQFAIDHSLKIDDDQLRLKPEFRMTTSVEENLKARKAARDTIKTLSDDEFRKFSNEMMEKSKTGNRYLDSGIRVRQGTRESNSWLHFGINQGTQPNTGEMYKAYVSLKDLNQLTPKRLMTFMVALRDAGYQGDIKTFQELREQGAVLNDQIVMHGNDQKNSKVAMQVAEQFFGDELDQKGFGKDEVIDGNNLSYSQVLALRIKKEVEAKANKLLS